MYLARYFGAHWMIVVLLGLLGGVGTGAMAVSQPPSYRAQVQLLVTFVPDQSSTGERPASAATAGKLMQRRVKTYASMMNTPRLTRPVIDSLNLPDTPARLGDNIVASSTLNTLAIDVAVEYGDATGAAAIANALAGELQRIADRDAAPAGLGSKAQVAVVSAAAAPERPEPVPWPLHAIGGTLGGFGIGLGIALSRAYRREGTPVSADVQAAWAAARMRLRRLGGTADGADSPIVVPRWRSGRHR